MEKKPTDLMADFQMRKELNHAVERIHEFTRHYTEQPALTVGDLKKMIANLPDDMEMLQTRYSDYQYQKASDWSLVEALPPGEGREWLMQSHHSMTDEQKAQLKVYLHIEGN